MLGRQLQESRAYSARVKEGRGETKVVSGMAGMRLLCSRGAGAWGTSNPCAQSICINSDIVKWLQNASTCICVCYKDDDGCQVLIPSTIPLMDAEAVAQWHVGD